MAELLFEGDDPLIKQPVQRRNNIGKGERNEKRI
jgi:hypothetical protein